MPELPEVETIKNDLKEQIIGKRIISVFPLWKEIVKDIPYELFVKQIEGKEIIDVERRAKNLIVRLSGGLNLLVHLKMTGHLFVEDEKSSEISKEGKWLKASSEDLVKDQQNQFIRIIFHLSGGKILAMGDMRKFAYIRLMDDRGLEEFLKNYGPEPLSSGFSAEKLASILKKKNTAIKKVLMDQSLVAGIGNIYADEILWASRVHPLSASSKLQDKDIEAIYENTRKILRLAIKRRGTSTSDFRDTKGLKGTYGDLRNVYQREGMPCPVCGGPVRKIKVGGRGTHFCPRCQKEVK
ncbi:bifunctional DNA-formamidopyrimidine glycosylase/DNA-(apurinic or apyrimidinic site) lyase [candidate division WS5 bacterium]|uniref:Bifunctional DNA-formamidopyrimidine glycosylase/DNA-(Apurinic or apyrimidinic site) lyase n=1 Tax=candidate division WS5 bacterium TaxID=2093353 RepID=A0A419DES7_9BACT|nr:MAG: bifunctional DNA-formamidopyrimidine glycosylase/DNA-(apurinic or apyrimidinic site) lyase [candidate division WS5 bacterium]